MSAPEAIKVTSEIADGAGNRLSLRYVEVPGPKPLDISGLPGDDVRFYDFHSLVWEFNNGSTWEQKTTITQDELEQDGTRRWISDLHSLDAKYGSAVIQIAEGEWRVTYSWRLWDLWSNKEIRLIRVCESPFDSLEDSDGPI